MDGNGIDGKWWSDGCAHSNYVRGVHWYSLELDAPRTVTKVQIARRTESGTEHQGKNVRITVGPSREYDPDEPLCRPEISQLYGTGLIDYPCTGSPKRGKYVKISQAGGTFVICEVKVFIRAEQDKTTTR